MKILVLFLFLIATPVLASQENPTRDELKQTLAHIKRLVLELRTDLDNEKAAHIQVDLALSHVTENLNNATAQITVLQSQINAQTAACNKAITERAHLLKKLHLAKLILSLAASAAVVFGVLKLLPIPPISYYVGGSALVIVNVLIWTLL